MLGFTLWNHFTFYTALFVLRPWFLFLLDKATDDHTTLYLKALITQGDVVTRADLPPLHSLALSYSMVISRFLRFSSVQLKKLELVNDKHERENKASTTKGNVRQILLKKSTSIVLIRSCFTALSIHPMKSVCKEIFKGYFSEMSKIHTSPHLLYWKLCTR